MVSREVEVWPRVFAALFFAIVDRVNLDVADVVGGFAPGGFGGVQVLMNESNFERRFQGSGTRDQRSEVGSVNCLLSSVLCLLISGAGSSVSKGIWWMPWHREAMKDVARCEKPRGAASRL